jgi:recombinational DNA repair protein RecR
MYSPSINKLITELKKLPSVGLHTAERFVFYWLKSGKKDVTELMLALKELIETVKSCEVCWNFDDQSQ